MQTFPLSEFEDDFTPNGFEKLSRSNARIMKGSKLVLITPAAERAGPNNIFEAWSQVFEANSSRMNKELLELEKKQAGKFGPRSIAKGFSSVSENVFNSFEPVNINTSRLRSFRRRNGNLRPTSLLISSQSTRSNTQAGAPTLEKKGLERENTVRDFKSLYDKNLPMVCAVRTQEQEKTRIVYIYPYADIMQENRYFLPLFERLRTETSFAAFNGPDAVDAAVTKMLLFVKDNPQFVCFSGDVSNFDDSVKEQLQTSGFEEVKSYFQASFHDELDEIAARFGHSKPLVLPDGTVRIGWHGIPSGSNLTGIIGSIVNRQVLNLPDHLCQIMGDDFIAITDNSTDIFKRYGEVILNTEESKTDIKPFSFVYLQRLHHLDYMVDGVAHGIYPTFRALNRLVYPERRSNFDEFDIKGRDYFAIRSLSILENCKYHPLFEEFVKFWLSYEKYKVPRKSSIAAFLRMQKSNVAPLGTTNQYGDAVSGIYAWESYKIAKRLVG